MRTKDKTIKFRCSNRDIESWKRAAKEQGLTLSAWITTALIRGYNRHEINKEAEQNGKD